MDGPQDVHFVEHEVRPGRAVSLADAMYTISPEYPRNPRFVFVFSAANKRGCSWMLWILAGKVFLLLLRMVSKAPTSMLLHLDSQSWQLKMKSFFATLDRFLLCKCEVMR